MEEREGTEKDIVSIEVRGYESKSRAVREARIQVGAKMYLRSGGDKQQTADAMGISLNTLYTYLRNPRFIELVNRFASEATKEVSPRLKHALPKALSALEKLLDSTDESIRLKAASKLFDIAERMKLDDPTLAEAQRTIAIVKTVIERRPELKAAFAEELKAERDNEYEVEEDGDT